MTVDYDPFSPEAMTDPQPIYARLRAEDPVHFMDQYDAWALASFDAVWRACSDTASFSMRKGPIPYQALLGEPASDLTFAGLDPPEHRLRRRVLAPHYTREAALDDGELIRSTARSVLDPLLAERCEFDAYLDYAHVVAGRVAASKAGVPIEDADTLRDRISTSFRREPGQRGTSAENLAAIMEVFTYLQGLVLAARQDPDRATGALATLVRADVERHPLTDEEVAAEVHTLMVTGSDTTEFGVTAALYYLAQNRHAQQELLDDPTLASAAFAEALRYDHPTEMLCRTVAKDVRIGGKTLREGQGVLLLRASANRDEAEFPKADEYDIHRRYERSLLFGHGQHKCIGEHIGMRMGTIMLHELVASIRSYSVDVDRVGRRCGEFLKGFNRMPVTVTR